MKLDNLLLEYLQEHNGWHKKVHLYIVAEEYGYSPETCGRQLRKLANEGKILGDYYDGMYARHLAKYAALDTKKPQPIKPKIEMRDGKLVAVY